VLQRIKRAWSRSSRLHHLSYDDFLYGSYIRTILRVEYRQAVNHIVDLLEPSSPVCRGVHLNRNDSRASESEVIGRAEKERVREQWDEKGDIRLAS